MREGKREALAYQVLVALSVQQRPMQPAAPASGLNRPVSHIATCLQVVLKSWHDMLALGLRLSHPAVKPRHLHTLLHWLKVHTDVQSSVRGQAGIDINLRSLYRMPTMHVDMDELELEESAARTSMAQLLSACCESSYTKELVVRLVDVSVGIHCS